MTQPANSNLVLTVGTQIVTLVEIRDGDRLLHPRGAVAVVVKSPLDFQHGYRVRFVDGLEESLQSNQLVMLSKFKEHGIAPVTATSDREDLYGRIIYRCIIGSRAYGLDTDASDVDYRGIYLAPAEAHWSLYGVPEQLEYEATQEAYWELQKLIVLALKSNPNVLECLYSPLVELCTPLGEQLLSERELFLSKLVYQTFNGYVMSQFKKMQADLRNHGEVKWKHVMHLLRLLLSGIHVLKERTVPVRVEQYRDELLAIRSGSVPWEETERWRKSLHVEFEHAYQSTRLPERPDYERANTFLIRARRAALATELP